MPILMLSRPRLGPITCSLTRKICSRQRAGAQQEREIARLALLRPVIGEAVAEDALDGGVVDDLARS